MTYDDYKKKYLSKQECTSIKHGDKEHQLQCSCVAWFRLQHPALSYNLIAYPAGDIRNKEYKQTREGNIIHYSPAGKRLKDEGVIAGVSDLILFHGNSMYHGLCIEMKASKNNQQQSQISWQHRVEAEKYKYVVCRSIEEFMNVINDYLSID